MVGCIKLLLLFLNSLYFDCFLVMNELTVFAFLIKMEFSVERILNAKTVTAASPMAPACGLYLGHVKYDLP